MQRGKITKGFRPLTIKLSVVYNVRLKTKPRMIFKRGIHTFRNLNLWATIHALQNCAAIAM